MLGVIAISLFLGMKIGGSPCWLSDRIESLFC